MERRAVVKGFLGMLGTAALAPLALPARLLAWGAISGLAPTHQYILTRAVQLLGPDPALRGTRFPSAEELTNQDYVTAVGVTKWGPGPDMDGNSNYSWHYYNPERGLGEAPFRSAEFFARMISERGFGSDTAQATAWGAHFLADMFVPYHTIGIPAQEAHDAWNWGRVRLENADCGPPQLYSLFEPPPEGWGLGNNFANALALFCTNFPPGSEADWFDPWYFNGYLGSWAPESVGVATGSHGAWEYWGWRDLSDEELEWRLQDFLSESFYDPLWRNARASFEGAPWEPQRQAIERFVRACAGRTRQEENFDLVLASPGVGIAAAVRAVLTFFRASLTDISLRVSQQPLSDGGYRLICEIENGNVEERLSEIEVRLTHNLQGRWEAAVTPYRGVLLPTATGRMFWDFPDGQPFQGILEVIGTHLQTPDLGYAKVEFQTQGVQREEVDPEVLITWQGQWTLLGRDLVGPKAGQTSNAGTFEIWVEGTTARIRSTMGPNILPVTVVDNGRCIEVDWSTETLFLKGSLCMGPDGNAFTGSMNGNTHQQNSPVQAEVWGQRIRQEPS